MSRTIRPGKVSQAVYTSSQLAPTTPEVPVLRPPAPFLPRRGGAPAGPTRAAPPPHPELVRREPAAGHPPEPDWEALAPAGWYGRWGHRVFDLGLLVLCLPPALLLGGAIALVNAWIFRDWRQVLFFQERMGYRDGVFRLVKFRTMRSAAGTHFASWGAGEDRLRVTRFGRLLRNTHLDELPQILNVLRGDMAFIGPRPEMMEIEEWARREVPGFATRMAVRPGITGYAQITQGYVGRDASGYARKLELSDRYRRHQSLALDLKILWRTALWMLCGRGWQSKPASEKAARRAA